MRHASLRIPRHPASRLGVWTERSEVPLARLHVVDARSNPRRDDEGNAPLRVPNTAPHLRQVHRVTAASAWISWRLTMSSDYSRRARMAWTVAAAAVRVVTTRTPWAVALLRVAPSS